MDAHLCSLCRTLPAKSICTCVPSSLVLLCSLCISDHSASNPFQIHNLYPFSALSSLASPAFLSRLQAKTSQHSQAKKELLENLKRLDCCRADFSSRLETLIESLSLYRSNTLELLENYRQRLADTIKDAVEEANKHLLDEEYSVSNPLAADLMEYTPGKLTLFQYEIAGDGKLNVTMRLPSFVRPKLSIESENVQKSEPATVDSAAALNSDSMLEGPIDLPKPILLTETREEPAAKKTAPKPKNPFFDSPPAVEIRESRLEENLQPPQSPNSGEMAKLGAMTEARDDLGPVLDLTKLRFSSVGWTPLPYKISPRSGVSLLNMTASPFTNTISLGERSGFGRYSAIANVTVDTLMICGGDDPLTASTVSLNFNTSEVSALQPMHNARFALGIAVYGACVYIFGGRNSSSALNSAERYRRKGKKWDLLPPMYRPRAFINPCIYNKSIYLLGGADDQSTEAFDILGMRCYELPIKVSLPGAATSVLVEDQLVVIQDGKGLLMKANLQGQSRTVEVDLKGR